jgi:hypothetical protein
VNPLDWIRDLYRQPAPGALCYSKGRWFYCPRGTEHDVLATFLIIVLAFALAFVFWLVKAMIQGDL